MEGYFPSELRDDYPEGVIFDLVDRHLASYESTAQKDGAERMSKEEFFDGVTKILIKDGEIVDVKGDLQLRLSASSLPIQQTSSNSTKPIYLPSIAADGPPTHSLYGQKTKLQLKGLGNAIIMVTMYENNTVGDVMAIVKERFESCNFELRSAFPPRVLDEKSTFNELGLHPTGTIHVKLLNSS
jgi:hypothetical protein